MVSFITDSQVVGETLSTLFSTVQSGPTSMSVIIKNSGVNTMNYRFQEYTGTAWADLGTSGSDLYNTLSPNEVKHVKVASNYPQVQMIGNASGGAFLEFAGMRYVNRASGGPLPLINL